MSLLSLGCYLEARDEAQPTHIDETSKRSANQARKSVIDKDCVSMGKGPCDDQTNWSNALDRIGAYSFTMEVVENLMHQ